MGSFEDHMRYGVAAYVVTLVLAGVPTAYLFQEGVVGNGEVALAVGGGVVGLPFAVAGAGFPDIDHHAAKPHRFFRRWVSVIAAVVGGYVLFASGLAVEAGVTTAAAVEAPGAPEPVVGGAFAALGAVALGATAFVGVGVVKPRHRGITHTLRAGFVVAGIVGVAVGYAVYVFVPSAAFFVGGVAATAFFVGFLSHLQCDGLLFGVLPDAM